MIKCIKSGEYDPRLDSECWKMAAELCSSKKGAETCDLCDSTNLIDQSLYTQAASAFTSYDKLCHECARALGFTIMIEGD